MNPNDFGEPPIVPLEPPVDLFLGVLTEISLQLLDGLPLHLFQTFMFPSG